MKRLAISLSTCALLLGALPAHAALITFTTTLSGANEADPNASPATGQATVTVDDVGNTVMVDFSYAGLLGTSTAAHIHCCTPVPLTGAVPPATAVPSFPGFVTGVQAGAYNQGFSLLDAGFYSPGFLAANGGSTSAARDALLAGMMAGRSYLNVHSSLFPTGEIRGFLVEQQPAQVPEPGSMALFALGAAGLGAWRRRGASARR